MSKNLLEAAERIADELTTEERLKFARELAQRTLKDSWNRLFAQLDQRRKGRRFTMAEIQREIDAVRRERRDVNHSRRH